MNDQHAVTAQRIPWWRMLSILALFVMLGTLSAQTTVIIGANSGANTTTSYPCPLGHYYQSQRAQYLYTAAELGAQGITNGMLITEIGWVANATTISGHNLPGYTISMKNTATTDLPIASWEAGTAVVYGPTAYSYTSGYAGNIKFPVSSFTYTGGNLLVEVCHNATGYTSNPAIQWSTLIGFNGQHTYRADVATGCGTASLTNTGTRTTRPRLVLTYIGSTACAIAAPGNTLTTGTADFCTGSTITLSTQQAAETGLTYQWQSSPNNVTYTDVTGATSPTLALLPAAAIWYQCVVTCNADAGNPVASTPLQVSVAANPIAYLAYNGVSYVQNFEAWVNACGTTDIPGASWKNTPATGNNSWRRNDLGASAGWSYLPGGAYSPTFSSGAYSAAFHTYGAPGASQGSLDLYLDMSAGSGTDVLSFDHINPTGTDVLDVSYSTNGGTSFTALGTPLGAVASWTPHEFTINSTSATTIIRFKCTSDFGNDDIGVDNLSLAPPAACQKPTLPIATNITTTTADLSWTASPSDPLNGYIWEIRSSGAAGDPSPDATGTTGYGVTSVIGASTLVANTAYVLYVQSDCGGLSPWSNGYSFHTPCNAATVPYSENFDLAVTPALPSCWSRETIAGNDWESFLASTYALPFTGNVAMYGYDPANNANSWLFTQPLSLVGGTSYRLSYQYGNDGGTYYPEAMDVWYGTGATSASMTDLLFDHPSISGVGNATNTLDFTPATNGDYTIGFHAKSLANMDILVLDEISVIESPACVAPTALALTGSTTTTADFSWTASASVPVNGYEWEVRTSGLPGTGGEDDLGTDPTSTLTASATGLSASSSYKFYVRSLCVGGPSDWAGPFNFNTVCGTVTAPYTQNFDAVASLPNCWVNQGTGENWGFLPSLAPPGPDYGVNGAADHSGSGNYAWIDGSGGILANGLESVDVDFSSLTNPQVSFWMLSNNVDDAAINPIRLDAWDGAVWTPLATFSGNDPNWVERTAAIPGSIPTTSRFRLVALQSPTGSAFYNDLLVDDFSVMETPNCLPPTALSVTNITATTADLSWTASVSDPANGYVWEIRSDGLPAGNPSPDVSGTTAYGVTTVVGATPLVANTTYKLYVRGDCDVDGFSTWAQTTFFTGYCQATSTSTAYEIGSFSTTGGFLNISNLNSGFSTNGYGDFTSLVVSQMAEGTVNFAADYPGDTYRSSIWVDWNNDLDFNDVGEQVFLNAGYTSSDAGSFDVPTGQADGDYRMRIRTDWLNAPVACGTGTYYGETEDYTFRVETPTCIAPVATVTSLTGGTTATIDWMNNASFSYNWELRATGNPGDPAPIASGYHVGNGPAIIGGLTPGGQYYFYLQGWCNAADSSYWSTTSVYMGYCAAGSDDDATTNIKIAQVTFADVDNATSSTLGYDDQTAVVGHVQAGAFYPIAIAVQDGYDADRIRVWIDFNHDLVFSGSELVATGANPPANVGPNGYTVNTNFHMSAHALAGTTRMRIRLDNTINGPQNSPCGNSGFGQVEDYTLDVTAAPCTAPTATATPVPDCGNFQFTVNVDVTSVGDAPGNVTVDDDQGSAQQNGPTGTYTFGPYPNGTNVTYLVSFGTALCDEYVSTTYACTPTNQACGSAQGLTVYPENGCVMTNGSTFNASTEPMTGSGCVNNVLTLPTVYYSFVATGFAQNITLNFASGSFNASVFDACGGNELSCSGFNSGTTLVSGLTLNNTYYVRVASTGTGNFTLCVSESSVQPVSNDDCANADPVTVSAYGACTPTIGQLLGATHSAQANPSCVNPTLGTADVFYSFVANGDRQIITMSQDSTNKVYMLAAYNGCGGTQLLCKLIGPTFDALGTEYMVTGLTANNTYIVRVLCRPAEAGPFALCVMDPPPPVQVNCGGAVVDEFYQPVDNDNQYWAYHSNGTGAFTLTFNSGDIESFTWDKLTIRDGVDGNAPILYQNPSAQTDLTGVTVTATGSDLFMTLTTDGSVTPTLFDWTVQCAYHPGQACNANPVDCGLTYPGLTTGLGHNMPANACPFNGPASTGGAEWFVYTAASDQAVTVSTCGQAGFDTRISVFSGADCNNLTCLGMMDDSPGCPGGSSTLTFNTVTNNSYWIAVSGSGAQEGSYSLSLICSPVCTPPGNDLCGSATGVNNTVADGTGMPTEYTNVCATVDAPTTCSGTLPVQGVWFTFNTGNFDHTLITLLDNDEDNQYSASTLNYALYSGLCDGLGATNSVSCVVDAGGINVENVTQNTWYRLLVYNTGGSGISGTFGLLVEHPAHNDASITAILDPAPGLLCGTTMAPQVTLLNNGDNNLTSVQITYGLSLGIPYVHNWTGNLAYGASANVTLPTVPAQAGPAQTLSISTSLPNGVADDIPANDGQNVAVDVGGEALVVVIQNDANDGSGLYWEIFDDGYNTVASGPSSVPGTNELVSEYHCLPVDFGFCFYFHLYDSFGDGLCCSNGNGYWELQRPDGKVLIRDLFDGAVDGASSPTYSPAYSAYFDHVVCLPPGPAQIANKSCDIFNFTMNSKVYCREVVGATSYQFEFSNPDAGYIRRIAVSTNWVRFSQMHTSPLSPGVKYFVRARTNDAGPVASAHFGTGCEVGMTPTVPCTELISAPTYGHSCGEERAFNTNNSFIYATPVVGATEYQFRIFIPSEGYDETFIRSTYILQLKWNNRPPMVNGSTYSVQVNVKVGTEYSGFCGQTCTITINNGNPRPEASMAQATGTATMWPNPVRESQVNLSIDGIQDADQNITVDIQDIYGKQVFAKEFGNSGERFTTILDLPSDIASGVYMVNITVNGQKTVQRLSIIK